MPINVVRLIANGEAYVVRSNRVSTLEWRTLAVICQEPYMRSEQPCRAMRLRTRKNPAWFDGVLGRDWEQLS
jgi:hypothetical protein